MFAELTGWDGELVATAFEPDTDAWLFVGLHSTVLGPGFGGTRLKVYPAPEDALRDVTRLSAAMTAKNALAGLPFGGGKAVLAVPRIPAGDERRRLLERYADLVCGLGGSYVTACDMNTTEADMDAIAGRCPHVMGTSLAAGGSGSSAPDTAAGVFYGIVAALAREGAAIEDSTVAVQGAGEVGGKVADLLAEAGAGVVVADVDETRATAAAARTGGRSVPPDEIYDVVGDVFSPCAVGGVLNPSTIPRLRCRVVAGSANNQLESPADGERLASAGIRYAPDVVVSAGGVLHLAGRERLGWTAGELRVRLEGIAGTLEEVFDLAERDGISTSAAAARLAAARVDAARTSWAGARTARAAGTPGSPASQEGRGT